jgi:hypothetical protein
MDADHLFLGAEPMPVGHVETERAPIGIEPEPKRDPFPSLSLMQQPARGFTTSERDAPLACEQLTTCGCVGPQGGQPVCPCQMRNVTVLNGRYVRIQDLGPAPAKP